MTYPEAEKLIKRLTELYYAKYNNYSGIAGFLTAVVTAWLSGHGDAEHYRKFIENEIKELTEKK